MELLGVAVLWIRAAGGMRRGVRVPLLPDSDNIRKQTLTDNRHLLSIQIRMTTSVSPDGLGSYKPLECREGKYSDYF